MKKERRLRTEILRLSQFSFFVFCFVFCFVPSISVSFDCVICYVMIPIKHFGHNAFCLPNLGAYWQYLVI